jgi:hypothetical protein
MNVAFVLTVIRTIVIVWHDSSAQVSNHKYPIHCQDEVHWTLRCAKCGGVPSYITLLVRNVNCVMAWQRSLLSYVLCCTVHG